MQSFRFPNLELEFERVRLRHGGGVFASASPHYSEAIFGRDSIEVAEDVLPFKPQVAKEVLMTLAGLQGLVFNPLSEEEPGKIHHEYRAAVIDKQPTSPHGLKMLKMLSKFWGGTDTELRYYGSVDATPLFIRLAMRYCQQEGGAILDEPVQRYDGTTVTLRESVLSGLDWLEKKINSSSCHLVDFCRINPKGHAYQVWKDGSSAYLHLNGRRANFNKPIAAIEVQGYAYDSFLGAAELGDDLTHDGLTQQRWHSLAKQLQQRVLRHFWMPEQLFVALAVDQDEFDQPRQVATICSNAGVLLESRLLDDLPMADQRKYVAGIVEGVYSRDFVTDVGVRSRSLQHHGLVDFADYHGSWAVWSKETYDIAKGLRRHGFAALAEQLELRILNGIYLSGRTSEFWYVDPRGRVDYDPFEKRRYRGKRLRLVGTHFSEDTQAWTISAALAIQQQLHAVKEDLTDGQPSWQEVLQKRLLRDVPYVTLLSSNKDAAVAYPKDYAWSIDQEEGRRRRLKFVNQPLV